MCGVAGVLSGQAGRPAGSEELRRMIAMLRHRGPDGWGLYRDEDVALAHARLSVVGLEDGDQPLSNEDERIWISGNGEVFNHVELRRELTARGHRFRTGSDTEAIVHAYEEWGHGAWSRLNGQFAFALWDRARRRLYLVRDRLGILPLLWSRSGDAVMFASEAKAILAGGRVEPSFDAKGLAQVFTRWSTIPPDTAFRCIHSVRPGCALEVDADLSTRERRYWGLRFEPSEALEGRALADLADELDDALSRAVDLRLRADVPVGCYVSGGLDSSVITGLTRRRRGDPGTPLRSYAVRFADPAFDETAEQRRVAALYGTDHHEVLCDASDIASALADVVWHCETPLLRTAPVPLFRLARLVRESGDKVVLTGEGADELLAGYAIFKEDRIRRFWARRPESEWRPRLLDRLYDYVGPGTRNPDAWRRFFARGLGDVGHPFYSHLPRWSNTAWSARFLAPEIRREMEPDALLAGLEAELPAGWRAWDPLARAQAIEISTFLSGYLLSCQGDRVAMGHGVEVRYPFLDPDVVELCSAMPPRARLLGLRDKLALRRMARRLLPSDLAERPKKPYRAPTTPALFDLRAPGWISRALEPEVLARNGLIDPAAARRLAVKALARRGAMSGEREEMALVGLVTLQALATQFLEELAPRAAVARAELERTPPAVEVDAARGVAA